MTDSVLMTELEPYEERLRFTREHIQQVMPGAVCLGRSAFDDPKIVEVWI